MAGINKVIIVGNLGSDIELRYTQDGRAIANLSIATSETWVDKNNQRQENTEWHRAVVFGKLAEVAGQYLHKGSKVYIEGKLQTRKWQDQQGQDRWSTEIIVSGYGGTLQMLDKKDDTPQQDNEQAPPPPKQQSSETAKPKSTEKKKEAEITPLDQGDDFEDDIPF